ncbi:MAG: hypothetical protein ACKPJC_09020 [Microcystis panniformis]
MALLIISTLKAKKIDTKSVDSSPQQAIAAKILLPQRFWPPIDAVISPVRLLSLKNRAVKRLRQKAQCQLWLQSVNASKSMKKTNCVTKNLGAFAPPNFVSAKLRGLAGSYRLIPIPRCKKPLPKSIPRWACFGKITH